MHTTEKEGRRLLESEVRGTDTHMGTWRAPKRKPLKVHLASVTSYVFGAVETSSCPPVILKDHDMISCIVDRQLGSEIVSLTILC